MAVSETRQPLWIPGWILGPRRCRCVGFTRRGPLCGWLQARTREPPDSTLKAPASLPRGFLSHARPLAACLSSCLLRPRHPEGRSRSVGVLTTSPGPSTFQVPDEHWLNARATASSRGSPQTFWTRTSSLSTEWKNVNEVRQVGPEMGRHPLCLPAMPRGPGGRGRVFGG